MEMPKRAGGRRSSKKVPADAPAAEGRGSPGSSKVVAAGRVTPGAGGPQGATPGADDLPRAAAAAADDAAAAAQGLTDSLAADARGAVDDAAAAAQGFTDSLAADARGAADDAAAAAQGLSEALAADARGAAEGARSAVEDARAAALGVTEALAADARAAADDAAAGALGVAESLVNAAAGAADGLLAAAAAAGAPATARVRAPLPPPQFGGGGARARGPADPAKAEKLKIKLLAAVASLDRGLAANVREAEEVDALAARLEAAGGGDADLGWTASSLGGGESGAEQLGGTWRLIYSSGFNSGSLGGRRPGPPAAFVPLVLGQVYQVIDPAAARLDNIVELFAALPALNLDIFNLGPASGPARGAPGAAARPRRDPAPGARLTLGHSYEVIAPSTVKIVYEDTLAAAMGPPLLAALPQIAAPQLPDFLKPPRDWRSASFDVTYLDRSMRVTRGDRGELRVYLRDTPLTAQAPEDYVD
ncbi:MAG: hypothetical protein J3K34DRAFT_468317 [Monoraphidium minutum]|nr:MAG: hypothetical protein J3K34DRAFT_468317 [Monoraphidium minutum]